MDDDSDNLAFRRVVVSVAERLTNEEVRKLIYIRLYSQREALFRNPQTLDVLAVLEQANVFGPTRPEGLLEILEKDLKNRQLANLVKVFIRNRNKKLQDYGDGDDDGGRYVKQGERPEMESDSRLKMCYKMATSQANVLVRHLEALRVATTAGDGVVDGAAARTALEDISEAASALARLKEKANLELLEASALRSASPEDETEQPDYEDVDLGGTEEETATEPLPDTPVISPTTTLLPLPSQPSQQKPGGLKPKPALKPKPKLNNPNTGLVVTRENPRNLPQSGFDPSSRSSSLPQLLEDTPENNTGENVYDDCISPELIEEAMSGDYDDEPQRRNSRGLVKTTSLPHISDTEQSPGDGSRSSFRPLPAPRTRNLDKHQRLSPTNEQAKISLTDEHVVRMDQDTSSREYAPLEPGEESEPIYDDIIEHTLLSRIPRQRLSSSSSSSSSD